jgi:hypothetical protein
LNYPVWLLTQELFGVLRQKDDVVDLAVFVGPPWFDVI